MGFGIGPPSYMNKLSRYILLAGALILFIGLAPRFLALDATQEFIAEKLGSSLHSEVTINDIRWQWLPVPHISLINTTIHNENARLTLPTISIYAHWRMLKTSKILPEKFFLKNPEILIRLGTTGRERRSAPYTIPETNIFIKNGTLKVRVKGDEGDRETALDIGYADIDILKTDTVLSISINKLSIKNP